MSKHRLSRAELDRRKRSLAGCRRLAYARSTGALTAIYDAALQGMDDTWGRWAIVCEDHGSMIESDTLKRAQWVATEPEEWCEACQDASYSRS